MEAAGKNGRRANCGALIIMRDALLFMALMMCFTLLYRISPALFFGPAHVRASGNVLEAAVSAAAAAQPSVLLPTADAATDTAIGSGTAAVSKAALVDEASAAAMAEALQSTAVPQTAPAINEPTGPVGDFSAAFPTTDTGVNALHSYQSDSLRISINKIAENGVTYFVADVWIKNIECFKTALAKGEYGRNIHEMPAKIAADNGVRFAVSGDYYGARDKGIVVRNGQLYRDVMNDDVCVLRTDGTLCAYSASEFSSLQSLDKTVWQAWAFGPTLVRDGAACDISSSKIKVKNPRCAIGFYEPGHYCFLVVDGRQDGYSSGMSLTELTDAFVSMGCKTAYNLDGGATAMMVFDGQVVNHPTNGGRASSDIICF